MKTSIDTHLATARAIVKAALEGLSNTSDAPADPDRLNNLMFALSSEVNQVIQLSDEEVSCSVESLH